MDIEIRPLQVPARVDAPDAATFIEHLELGNALEREVWGNDDFDRTLDAVLPSYLDQRFERRIGMIAHLDGELVGRGVVAYQRGEGETTAWLEVGVAPAARRGGVGSALLADAEAAALAEGRTIAEIATQHTVEQVQASATRLGGADGERVIPGDDPAVLWALARGYTLGQAERMNRCDVAAIAPDLPQLIADGERRSGASYALRYWSGRTPSDLLDTMANAREHMALDVPAGGLHVDAEHWSASRVENRDGQFVASGETPLGVAAIHLESGTIAGYSELILTDGKQIAEQYDTLVLADHRGHGLGMRLKSANLQRLIDLAPERARVYTWNADENRYMLAINDRLGFQVVGYTGIWQRAL